MNEIEQKLHGASFQWRRLRISREAKTCMVGLQVKDARGDVILDDERQ